MMYDTCQEYLDDLDEEERDEVEYEEDYVVGVQFESSLKVYTYFTDDANLKKGDKLVIKSRDRRALVTVRGYSDSSNANKELRIISKPATPQKRKNKFQRGGTMNTKLMNAAKDTLTTTKDVAIKVQKGQAVITAIKTALTESDTVPEKIKEFLEIDGYSDLVIGFIMSVAANAFSDSEIIQDAAEAANFMGSIEFSKQFTVIQEMIEKTVSGTIGKVNKATKPKIKKNKKK